MTGVGGVGGVVTVDEVDVDPTTARVYAEGWQSWSPTGWSAAGSTPEHPRLPWEHAMRLRPGARLAEEGATGHGLLVVDPGDSSPVRTYRAPSPTAVPTLHATLVGTRVVVESDGEVVHRLRPGGPDAGLRALEEVGDAFAAVAGAPAVRPAPRVWCSWYRYFEEVTTADVLENVAALDAHGLPVDVVQVDDGWGAGTGGWHAPRPGVPDLGELVDRVRAAGYRAGAWLAPFVVGRDTDLARRYPEWLVGWAGHNWGQDLAGLDLTHPGVQEYLLGTVARLRATGVDYLKLDFLYAGALPGRRYADVDPVVAYRTGLGLVREAAGDAYFLGCGAPLLPSVGLLDAMRVSSDTFHEGAQDGSAGLRGQGPVQARWWQQGRFWANDPDCLVLRPSYPLRERWAGVVAAHGGLRSLSDRVAELDPWGLRTARELLASAPGPGPFAVDAGRASLRRP